MAYWRKKRYDTVEGSLIAAKMRDETIEQS